MDILERIQNAEPTLNKTRKRIARLILDNPSKCCFMSLKEFANSTNTTEATVLSFCRGLEIGSYIEFRKELQTHVLMWTQPSDRLAVLAERIGTFSEFYDTFSKAEKDSLNETFDINTKAQMLLFIQMIKKAKKVFVAAHDASRMAGKYLTTRLIHLGVDISELDMEDTQQVFSRLYFCKADEALLIPITTPPYGDCTIAVTKMCRERSIPIAAITDSNLSPVVQMSDAVLICPSGLFGLTNSYTSVIAMIEAIVLSYRFEEPESSIKEIQKGQEEWKNLYQKFMKSIKNN